MGKIFGYIFSGEAKEEEQQREVLKSMRIPERNIFADQWQENGGDRPMLKRMEQKLAPDDLVYIKSLNWLGNSYEEILTHWRILTKKRKADIAVLDMPLLDTRRGKEFMESLISDVVMEMLIFVSENEHDKNQRRSKASYQAAKARGVQYGRPMTPLPDNFPYAYERWKAGLITGSAAASECGMPLSTFRWRANRYEEEQKNLDTAVNH